MMTSLTKTASRSAGLSTLGPKSRAALAQVGVTTLAQLQTLGAVPAYVLAKRLQPTLSLNFLYGLTGAIEDCSWRLIQRERKLELLNAIEDYERRHPVAGVAELDQLRNIGKAMLKDFELLGIASVTQLACCNPDQLYANIQSITGSRHDPCVWDTFAAAIHQAKTGEALSWWEFTKLRKARQANQNFAQPWKPNSAATIHPPTSQSGIRSKSR